MVAATAEAALAAAVEMVVGPMGEETVGDREMAVGG